MRRSNFLIIAFIVLGLNCLSFAQVSEFDFKNFKVTANGKVVYFNITSLIDDAHANEISNSLKAHPGVIDCSIKKVKTSENTIFECKIKLSNNVSAGTIRAILKTKNADFDLNSVIYSEKNTLKRKDGMPEHYPMYTNTGNKDVDKARFDKEKKDWAEKYPDEVKSLRNTKDESSKAKEIPSGIVK